MPSDERPIYEQIADKLRARALQTQGTAALSVRKVAGEFGVSAVTASRALQLFRVPQTDDAAQSGASGSAGGRWAVCLHVSPGPHQHAAAQITADGFRSLARQRSAVFDFDCLRFGDEVDTRRMKTLVSQAVENGYQGIFLLPSRISDEAMGADEALLAAAEDAKLPVVLLERNLRGEDRTLAHDLVSFHDFEGGRLLTRHLAEQGRKRIAFITGSPTSSHVERLAGYLSAVRSFGLTDSLVLEQSSLAIAGSPYTQLVTELIKKRADSVICFHEYAAVGIVLELLRRGKSVPADTAVAAFYNLGLGESFSIGITTYSFPALTVAARALDIMQWRIKSPGAPPLKVVVPGELTIRNSSSA